MYNIIESKYTGLAIITDKIWFYRDPVDFRYQKLLQVIFIKSAYMNKSVAKLINII